MEAVRQTTYGIDVAVMENPITSTTRRNLIDPNWREQPMRAWDDLYEDLCREVGAAYGLNDMFISTALCRRA